MDWIPWTPGPCPVGPYELVQVWLAGELEEDAAANEPTEACGWDWSDNPLPIIAYRVVAQ